MKYRLKKVAVLGSGLMGSGIACHLANVGMEVLLLDIVPAGADKDQVSRNHLADTALQTAIKSKPAPLYHKSFASRIKAGNFEDDFKKISEVDWIIEVVVERLDIKKQILEKVDQFRKKGSLVSSNTSSIPIQLLAEDRSEDFKKHFCGTHFFNPARYLRLLEVIPTAETAAELTEFFMEFGKITLGKQTVLCKDTPAFIGNRIGVMSGTEITLLTEKYNFKIEEVDAMTGSLIGRPNTASFRLQDLVGLDTGDNVSRFVMNNVEGDAYIDALKNRPEPKFMRFLLDNKFLGNKTGKGFYEKTKEKDAEGKTKINALNLETLTYEPAIRPKIELVKTAKGMSLMDKRMQYLVEGDSKEHHFFKDYFGALLGYAAARVPEISDQYFPIDDAMRTGYVWDFGPFEYWDLIGLERGIELIKAQKGQIPQWVADLQAAGGTSFYKFENGHKKYFNIQTKKYEPLLGTESLIILDTYREQTPVLKNSECTVHDIGEGVLCLEFTSKSNSIGEGIGKGLHEIIELAEQGDWKGLVIGNNAKQFSVGANLMNIGMFAMQKQFDVLERFVDDFQQINMKIRTSKIPVVVATQGYVFGGGCEISMHCDAGIYAAESYIGLVEVGVGLLPGGGGTKEFALRASDDFFEGDVQNPTLINYFKSIATASVSTSAYEAYDLGYLKKDRDFVCVNTPMNIGRAKDKVLELAKNYMPPSSRTDIQVLGRGGMSVLYSAINEFRLGEYMSDYDVEIARKIAYVICGGDLTAPQKVSEQYLLDIEREGFMSLLGNQKTLDRIQYLLMNNKPLRN
ncbi:3-hydroxyacyl-CoA dehydrogenase/enoyl-CoA hydratase family protein [Flavobacteriaceae bacterium]|jgi:3-hydroxyacyl-CoA dehydrogenase|nr:3-hydroxyacyl-CoA dehydrogenase/enoyl-CoA hydratase family protein [Flavobacteriaceae bacterium]MDA9587597.1 3-hydroxyacyl-CoA dehydrogenase/enoyl-CoA hydratase family protein [Flavobacteriaceae bacterium]MDC0872788.1 3-hydroxyacyl-CoA dehydrogenase/enoyl-CoA hydratase family protein [Flavobacteriaceae bacterium]